MGLLALGLSWTLTAAASPDTCRPCHAALVRAYEQSPMGRSLQQPGTLPAAQFTHQPAAAELSVKTNGVLRHSIRQQGMQAEYPVAFAIGSGRVGHSFAVRIGERLFQSPLSWFSQRQSWGISPGYEREANPDFDRPITAECLHCHASNARTDAANRLQSAPTAISCERCHGDTARHLAEPGRGTILNPARLTGAVRDSICEQCHLAGSARVLRPGKQVTDFQAGQPLEDTWTTFVESAPASLRVVSHSEQLALSQCARASSGQLWCGTCHGVHSAKDTTTTCRGCHATLSTAHPAALTECASCHMPKLATSDVHAVYTDHRIQVPGRAVALSATTELRPWRPGPVATAQRDLGLAYMQVGQQRLNGALAQQGFQLLLEGPGLASTDPAVLRALASGLLLKNRPGDAATLLRRALQQQPSDARLLYQLAAAEERAGQRTAAARSLEQAIAADESFLEAYILLAQLQPDPAARAAVLRRYLQFRPDAIAVRRALQR